MARERAVMLESSLSSHSEVGLQKDQDWLDSRRQQFKDKRH